MPTQPVLDAQPATVAQRVADRVVDVVLAIAKGVGAVVGRALRRPFGRAWTVVARGLRVRPDVLTRPTPMGMRRLAVAGLVANGVIVVSGGLVRLTKSGLGCPTWPRCTPDSLIPAPHTDVPAMQMAIEFGNRMLTFVLLTVGIVVFVAAGHLRAPRPDLVRLAVVQPLGILAQGALGGLTVLSGLHPAVVGAHYLLSALVLVACVALVVRSNEGDGRPTPVAGPLTTRVTTLLPYAGFVLLAAGTVVTGAGPHAGDDDAERYAFLGNGTVELAARVHSLAMWATLALVVALLVLVRREPAPSVEGVARLSQRTTVLSLVIVGQGAVGYLQYLTGVPAWLVLLHLAGSVVFWVTLLFVRFAIRDRGPASPGPAKPELRLP